MSHRSNHATRVPAWIVALLLTALACADSAPLPGYVPDPDEYTVPADAAKVREVPDSPGLEAPVDHMLLVLDTDAGREVAESIAASEGGTIVGQIPALRFYQLKLPTETVEALLAAVDRARLVPGVDAAGLDPVVQFSSCPAESDIERLPTSDLRCPWEAADYSPTLTAFEEMREELELHEVTVGIVDSPLDRASGEFDDVRLISVDHRGGRFPEEGEYEGHYHGTAVAQIVAGDDDTGINGIASRFLGRRLRVAYSGLPMGATVRATAANVVTGARRVVAAGARVVNLSVEVSEAVGLARSDLDAFRRSMELVFDAHRQVLFVVAAGNRRVELDGVTTVPGGIVRPNVLTVGSSASCNPLAAALHSNWGSRVDLAAQGEGVWVYDSSVGREVTRTGTSFAAPQGTGLAAILVSIAPDLDASAIRDAILEGAAPGPLELGGRFLNHGRPLLELLRQRGSAFDDVIDRDGDGDADPVASVAARLCEGSVYEVETVGGFTYYPNDEEATQLGQIGGRDLDGQFGMAIQHAGADGLAFVIEAPFALESFAIGDGTTGTVSFVDSARMLGGNVVSGTWTLESCAILDRWDRLVANTDAPKTVLVRSSLDAVVELNLPDEEDLRVAIRGSFAVPFESFAGGRAGDRRVEFDVDDPVLRTLEASCEGGR